jgi:hypothetical protein
MPFGLRFHIHRDLNLYLLGQIILVSLISCYLSYQVIYILFYFREVNPTRTLQTKPDFFFAHFVLKSIIHGLN